MSESEKIKVFISYASEDYDMAKRLYDDLNKVGVKPWIDREDLLSGQDWKTTIQQAINASRYFLLLISKNSISSRGYFQKEQRTALELRDESPLDRIYTIPVKLDDTEPIDERVKGLFPADISKDYEEGWKQIMRVLKDTSDTDPVEQKSGQTDFVNRSSELHTITHQYSPPYLLIVGPIGYGKTELLRVVKQRLQRQWLCVSISISKEMISVNDIAKEILKALGKNEDNNFETSEYAGYEIGGYILKEVLPADQKKIMIQIDNAENLPENVVKELINQFIPALADTLHNADATLRLMFAGRYISDWQQLSYEIRFKQILLTPFDFDAVYQSVEYFDFSSRKAVMPMGYKKDFSAWLMYFTGGHIKAMSEILINHYKSPMKVITRKEKELYEIVTPVIEDIKNHIHPADLKDIMETLSVVRRFNSRLLENFIKNNLIKWDQSEIKLEDSLLQTYLVNRKDGFLQDDISRRLLAIHLRRNDLNRFVKICEQAISFYEDRLNDPKSRRPDIIAVELLFQKLLYISYKQKGSKEDFLNIVPDILNILVSGREDSIAIMENFIQLLNEDWEFRFTFNYLFRERGGYNDRTPINELMKKTVEFLENRKGDKNA